MLCPEKEVREWKYKNDLETSMHSNQNVVEITDIRFKNKYFILTTNKRSSSISRCDFFIKM